MEKSWGCKSYPLLLLLKSAWGYEKHYLKLLIEILVRTSWTRNRAVLHLLVYCSGEIISGPYAVSVFRQSIQLLSNFTSFPSTCNQKIDWLNSLIFGLLMLQKYGPCNLRSVLGLWPVNLIMNLAWIEPFMVKWSGCQWHIYNICLFAVFHSKMIVDFHVL